MRFMVLVKANKDSEAGVMPSPELLTEMGKFNDELIKAGVLVAGEGLHPTSNGARIRFRGKERIVTDGPFTESKDLVAGFWIWEVKNRDEAIAWAKKIPNPMPDSPESEVEIRQIFGEEDFGELAQQVPEVFEKERKFREQQEARRQDDLRTVERPQP
ncbi:MAG: YciI family protein [Thermoanaerobaculia bacterium]